MDANKKAQATQIIASKIASIPANTPMDYGTIGGQKGMTKREGEAMSMAQYFVSKIEGIKITGSLEMTAAEKMVVDTAKEIAAAAIAISGK